MGNYTKQPGLLKVSTPINAVTTTTTSAVISLLGAKKVSLMLTRADHVAGSTTWTVLVSLDGVVFEPFNQLITNVTNTNVQNHARVASLAQAANAVDLLHMDLEHAAYHSMKLIATGVTDGTYTGVVAIET